MYIKFENGIVAEIIPDIDPTFPDVPIGERYPVDFIEELLHVEDGTKVEIGMEYDAGNRQLLVSRGNRRTRRR